MIEGPYLAKQRVMDYLSSDLPSRIIVYRAHWGIGASALPNPEEYLSYEPLTIDHWPSIYTIIASTTSVGPAGYDVAMNAEYQVRYSARTYIWVKAANEAPTIAMRDRMVAVVRDALLDHPSLYAEGEEVVCTDGLPHIDEGTLREEFSDLSPLKGDRFMAGAYISYDIVADEIVERPAIFDPSVLGVALRFILDVDVIPRVPNAPTRVVGVGGANAGEVVLAWRASTWSGEDGPILGYKVEKSSDDGVTWSTVTTNTGTTTPLYLVAGLTPGGSYMFRVSAFNDVGVGAVSDPTVNITATDD